jgi:hypothetical protein
MDNQQAVSSVRDATQEGGGIERLTKTAAQRLARRRFVTKVLTSGVVVLVMQALGVDERAEAQIGGCNTCCETFCSSCFASFTGTCCSPDFQYCYSGGYCSCTPSCNCYFFRTCLQVCNGGWVQIQCQNCGF